MGQRELEAALLREGEEKVREIWQSAERDARRRREEVDEKIRVAVNESRVRRNKGVIQLQERMKAAAEDRSRVCRLEIEERLAQRLRCLAMALLVTMAEAGGESLFQALASEIPGSDWCWIKVHPRDEPLARTVFRNAEVRLDEAISGGLEVGDEEDRLHIINTLEKRLEQLWKELLPEMIMTLRKRVGNDEATTRDTSC